MLPEAELVRGRVRLSDAPEGFSYSGLQVSMEQQGRWSATAWVDREGRFSKRLLFGPVRIIVATESDALATFDREVPCGELELPLDGHVGRLRAKNLDLPHGDRTREEGTFLRLEPAGAKPGTWIDPPEESHLYRIGPEGTYGPTLGWERDDLCAWFLEPGTYDAYVGHGRVRVLAHLGRVEVVAGEERVIDAAALASSAVRGTVLTAEGAPIAGTDVTAVARAMIRLSWLSPPIHASTDAEGRYAFDPIASGGWIVYPSSLGSASPEARAIELARGDAATVDFTIAAPGGLEGTVVRDGRAVAGAVVNVFRGSEGLVVPRRAQSAVTDAGGRYAVADLVPGAYWVQVWDGGVDGPRRRVVVVQREVHAKEPTRCDFDLDFALTTLHVTRDGVSFDAIDDGFAQTPLTSHRLERVDGSAWGARLAGGPTVLLFKSREVDVAETPSGRPLYFVAFLRAAPAGAPATEVELGGATIVVRRRSSYVALPSARLASIAGYGEETAALVHVDEAGERRFPCVPFGSVVVLQGGGSLDGPLQSLTLDVGTRPEVVVDWPPR